MKTPDSALCLVLKQLLFVKTLCFPHSGMFAYDSKH